VSASSSVAATASSTVAATTDRQVGVVSRSARELHSCLASLARLGVFS